MKVYKVWIEIEEHDDEVDKYSTIDNLDFAATAAFDTLEEAEQFANELHRKGTN